jgi:hypothetical protein
MIFLDISEWIVDAFIFSIALLAVTISLFLIMLLVSALFTFVERRWYGKY